VFLQKAVIRGDKREISTRRDEIVREITAE
jgi:hypothetical protein